AHTITNFLKKPRSREQRDVEKALSFGLGTDQSDGVFSRGNHVHMHGENPSGRFIGS
ncbi:MAG: hypothetical protein QG577_623, partial [Thermodesulfobacteriota bacterium]|nr:hypothetical protein [Thermodesulfobacteriota bacterium]